MLQFDALTAGIDEAGRGPLAGPVVAAVVCFPASAQNLPWLAEIQDSKALTPAARERLSALITAHADTAYGAASVTEIDRINILAASLLAMRRACMRLNRIPQKILVDGNRLPDNLPAPTEYVIRGDKTHLAIAAASILAKTLRDSLMAKLAARYPHYGWQTNQGYASQTHRQTIITHGITPHHRKSFAPVKTYIANTTS